MKLTIKYIKRFFIIFSILIGISMLTLFILLKYRLKETLSYIVEYESNGCYELSIGRSKLNFNKEEIKLDNVILRSKNCQNIPIKYITIQKIDLKITSFFSILTKGKIDILKMHITDPKLSVHLKKNNKKINFKEVLNKIHVKLASIGGRLQLKDFKIIHADIKLIQKNKSFLLNDLNVNIDHFKYDSKNKTFDASYDIDSKKQKIKIANKTIDLDGFTLKDNLRLTVNNFKYTDKPIFDTSLNNQIYIQTINFKINPSFFKNEGLIIDELILDQPNISFHTHKKDSIQPKKIQLTNVFALFDFLEVKQMSIVNLNLALPKNKFNTKGISIQQKSFELDNLMANQSDGLSCEKLNLKEDSIQIFSSDKREDITFTSFGFQNNDIEIIHPKYKTTDITKGKTLNLFDLEAIKFYDLDIAKALDNKYIARKLSVIRPTINLNKYELKTKKKIQIENLNEQFMIQSKKIKKLFEVDELGIENGTIQYHNFEKSENLSIRGININIDTKSINESTTIESLNKTIKFIACKKLDYESKKNGKIHLESIILNVKDGNYFVKQLNIDTKKIKGQLEEMDIKKFNLKYFLDSEKVQINKIKVQSFNFNLYTSQKNSKEKTEKTSKKFDLSAIQIDTLALKEISFTSHKQDKKEFSFDINQLFLTHLKTKNKIYEWDELKAKIDEIYVHNDSKNISYDVENVEINDQTFMVNNIGLNLTKSGQNTTLALPQLMVTLPSKSFNVNKPHLQQIHFPSANIGINIKHVNPVKEDANTHKNSIIKHIPPIKIDEISLAKNEITFNYTKKEEQINATINIMLNLKNIKLKELNNFEISKENLKQLPLKLDIALDVNGKISNSNFGKYQFSSETFSLKNDENINFDDLISFIDKPYIISDKVSLESSNLNLKSAKFNFKASYLSYSNKSHDLMVKDLHFNLTKNKNEFLADQKYQSLYAQIEKGDLSIKNISFKDIIEEKKYHIERIELKGVIANLSKDKTKPFEHNILKPMLTDFFMNYKYDFKINEIALIDNTINYDEKSEKTGKVGEMCFSKMNGIIKNITSKPNAKDSLEVDATMDFESVPIHKFIYKESYLDTLSAFRYEILAGKNDLQKLSKITVPLISLEVLKGNCESLHTKIRGNKYAAIGYMKFKYNNLEIKLDSNQKVRSNFLLKIINFAANDLVLHKKNKKSSKVFFIRDQEKFIINLWVKSLLSGIYTSVGLKKDKKYYKEYKEYRELYHLPKKY